MKQEANMDNETSMKRQSLKLYLNLTGFNTPVGSGEISADAPWNIIAIASLASSFLVAYQVSNTIVIMSTVPLAIVTLVFYSTISDNALKPNGLVAYTRRHCWMGGWKRG